MKKEIKQKAGVRGEITAKFYDQKTLTERQKKINKKLDFFRINFVDKLPSRKIKKFFYKKIQEAYNFGKLKQIYKKNNVICNVGFNNITKRLTGDPVGLGELNKALLGDGVGSASASDVALINEVYRNDILSGTDSNNIAIFTVVFTEAEVSGTFTEFGNCIDGEAGIDTGLLWSHITGLNWVKDTNTALLISCKYTFASV